MQNRILFKIYTIWFLRRIVPLMIIQIIVLVGVLKLLANQIFLSKVLENAAISANSSYWEFFQYLIGAFFQAHFLVQLFILLILGFGALLLRDLARAVKNYLKTFSQ